MRYLVTPSWVISQLEKQNVRVVDCRFQLGNPAQGEKEYREAHIPGAVHFDLEKDMSAPIDTHGGRHPLPDMDEFADKLSKAGIDQDTTVVAYDDQGSAMASRFWWMLMYLGHKQTFVLDRPFAQWEQSGFPVEYRIPTFEKKVFIPQNEPHMLVHLEEVKLGLQEEGVQLIDGRDEERFSGKQDNVDGVAGHIPGAEQFFWKDVLDENGEWKDIAALKQHFKDLTDEKKIISYCGSGVTACVNVLALKEAGYENPKLYVGSWSDWVSYDDLPISKG